MKHSNVAEPFSPITRPWACTRQELLERLEVTAAQGLEHTAVAQRQQLYGSNRLREGRTRSVWGIQAAQCTNIIVLLLGIAAGLAFVFGKWPDGIAMTIVIAFNTAMGFLRNYAPPVLWRHCIV
jgi:Ca2+-transporting ATPase